MKLPQISEEAYQDQLVELAHICGWFALHIRAAKKADGTWYVPVSYDGDGWPDLFMAHPKGFRFAAEVKDHIRKATAKQLFWLDLLNKAGVPAYLWRPKDFDDAKRVIMAPLA